MPRAIGTTSTSATTEVPITATVYTEQTSGAQRSLKSSSASDAAAGTGARTVRITYYTLGADGSIAGPFVEVVTLNGTAAVATVATNIALIEKLEVVTAGSGGVPAGTISLYTDNAGAGSVIASIATGAVRTFFAHHYVPSGKLCEVTDLEAIGGDTAAALVQVKALPYPTGIEQPISGSYGCTTTLPRGVAFPKADAGPVAGPARIRLTVTPANGNAQVTRASFGFVDRGTGALQGV